MHLSLLSTFRNTNVCTPAPVKNPSFTHYTFKHNISSSSSSISLESFHSQFSNNIPEQRSTENHFAISVADSFAPAEPSRIRRICISSSVMCKAVAAILISGSII